MTLEVRKTNGQVRLSGNATEQEIENQDVAEENSVYEEKIRKYRNLEARWGFELAYPTLKEVKELQEESEKEDSDLRYWVYKAMKGINGIPQGLTVAGYVRLKDELRNGENFVLTVAELKELGWEIEADDEAEATIYFYCDESEVVGTIDIDGVDFGKVAGDEKTVIESFIELIKLRLQNKLNK